MMDDRAVRVMLDTSAINALVKGDPADRARVVEAVAARRLVLDTTHVQRDELAQTGDPKLRGRLLGPYDELAATEHATSGFIIGASRIGHARLGTDEAAEAIAAIVNRDGRRGTQRTPFRWGVGDDLIARTAMTLGVPLVTGDGDHARYPEVEVWSIEDLLAALDEQPA